MRALILLSVLVMASACAPCRLLSTDTRDSVRIITRERVTEKLVRDTVYVEIPAQSEARTTRDTTSHLQNDYATSDARINGDGTLYHDLRTKPQNRPVITDRKDTERVRTDTIYLDKKITNVVEVELRLTWWQQTQIRGFWALLIVVLWMCRKGIVGIIGRFIS